MLPRLDPVNNNSERELRSIAVGRKAWLFSGSDGHAESAAAIMSLIASAKLHGLDPEVYVRDMIRVLPHWKGLPHLALTPGCLFRRTPRGEIECTATG